MLANIEEIHRYTHRHPELRAAHHWLYDSIYGDGTPEFVVMGVNPGETKKDLEDAPGPTEETSRYDFHPGGKGRGLSTGAWARSAERVLRGKPYVLAEAFFWSSRDGAQFRERYGELGRSPHLPFCTAMNRSLINHYSPKAVLVSGLGLRSFLALQYGLSHVSSVAGRRGRLLEHYSDGGRPWIVTKHWSASFGFSNADRDEIADFVDAVCRQQPA